MTVNLVGLNPARRPRRSSAGKRRQAVKRAKTRVITEAARDELKLAAAEYAKSADVRARMDARDRLFSALYGGGQS